MKTLSPSGGGRGRKDDFVCKELLFVIEVDGYSLLLEETILKDNLKEDYLAKEVYRMLRFRDKDVMTDIKNVIRTLTYESDKSLPLPPPEGDKRLGNDNE